MINLTLGMTLPKLAPEQERAIDAILAWLRSSRREMRVAGLAGTGKTTILAYLYEYLDAKVIVASYTGKSVAVLRKRGITDATTLHRLLYYSSYNKRAGDWNHRTKKFLDRHDVVMVDEASMVSPRIRDELLAKARKVLFVGDPGQLEPIEGGGGFMEDADIKLSQIHRQALDNPIIRFSHRLRHDKPFGYGRLGRLNIFPLSTYDDVDLTAYDMIACGLNATRMRINREIRERKGYRDILCLGERIVCLENDTNLHVFNGETFTVAELREPFEDRDGEKVIEARLVDETNEDRGWIPIRTQALLNAAHNTPKRERDGLNFQYGGCLTVHKLQASEYDNVLGIDEPPGSCDPKKWRYTMTTRAVKHLTYLTDIPQYQHHNTTLAA